jgi:hypothetical protein
LRGRPAGLRRNGGYTDRTFKMPNPNYYLP